MMLQHDVPQDFVIATGIQHSVRDCVQIAGAELGMTIEFVGEGADETGIDTATGRTIVRVDPRYYRPAEVETLLGDPAKAKAVLGWEPKVTFQELIREMVASDLSHAKQEAVLRDAGYTVVASHE